MVLAFVFAAGINFFSYFYSDMAASPSNAHLFIVAPVISARDLANLFSTHPPIAKRVKRLIGRSGMYGVQSK